MKKIVLGYFYINDKAHDGNKSLGTQKFIKRYPSLNF